MNIADWIFFAFGCFGMAAGVACFVAVCRTRNLELAVAYAFLTIVLIGLGTALAGAAMTFA